jgi:hypothetical protein
VRHPGDFDFTNPPGHRDHYRNQPRVPAGHREGGQWTDGKDRQLSKLRLAFSDLDPSVRTSPPQIPTPPQTPQIPSPPLQPRAPNSLPQPRIPSQPPSRWWWGGAFSAALAALQRQRYSDATILNRYDQLSDGNNSQRQAALFLGRGFGRDRATGQFGLVDAQWLTREQVDKICGDGTDEGLKQVQAWVDEAVKKTEPDRHNLSEGPYGTEIHTKVEHMVRGNRKFRAEPSFILREDGGLTPLSPKARALLEERGTFDDKGFLTPTADRGQKGSVRPDLDQPRGKDTVCIYDIKTGDWGLTPERMEEFVRAIEKADPEQEIKTIVVIQVRPTGWRPRRWLR